jgi:uncharacterized protein (DUF488 family)
LYRGGRAGAVNRTGVERRTLFTIGYEGRSLDALVLRLREAAVTRVIDVRASPRSARPGFGRAALARAFAAAGLEYSHLAAAGNPFRADAAKDLAGVLDRFRAHLDAHPEVPRAVLDAAEGARTALLCAEANPRRCHRSVLAERLGEVDPGLAVIHL